MSRFDIYRRTGGAGFLVDIQDNLLRDLNTRIVAPLLPLSEAPKPAQRLNPVFEIAILFLK
jgi:toxin CcdB